MVKEIAFTAYPVTDMARARAFYEGVLGLKVETQFAEQWIEYGLGAGTFVLQTFTPDPPSGDRGTVAFEVDDFEATVASLKAAAVPFVMEPMESPVCHFAMVLDPEGNKLMVHRRKSA